MDRSVTTVILSESQAARMPRDIYVITNGSLHYVYFSPLRKVGAPLVQFFFTFGVLFLQENC